MTCRQSRRYPGSTVRNSPDKSASRQQTTLTRCAFIATNPEALLPHSIASTPPLGANLLTPNSLRRARGPELGSLDCEHVFDRLLPTVQRKIKEATVPLG